MEQGTALAVVEEHEAHRKTRGPPQAVLAPTEFSTPLIARSGYNEHRYGSLLRSMSYVRCIHVCTEIPRFEQLYVSVILW
jgi:hypothetical protein